MPTAQNPYPMKMDTSLIEKHYNRGRPMSDLALHAAQYFRPRKMNNPPIQRERQHQHYEGDNMSGSKRKVVEIADKRNSATSTPSKKNAPEPDTTDTHPTKRAKHSPSQESGARSNKAIALSQSIEAMLARQASKPNAMISRRTRPVHAGARARAGSDAAATAADENEATTVGGGAAAVGVFFRRDRGNAQRRWRCCAGSVGDVGEGNFVSDAQGRGGANERTDDVFRIAAEVQEVEISGEGGSDA